MNITSRENTIRLGLDLHQAWPHIADLATDFFLAWRDRAFWFYRGEEYFRRWIGDLTHLVAEVMRHAGIRCDADVVSCVLVDAVLHCGLESVAGLAAVKQLSMPAHRAPRRHLEFAVAALGLLEMIVVNALERLDEGGRDALTRSYTRVTVFGGRDTHPEQVYGFGNEAVEQFTEGEE
jgi:ribulose 1,5-bisphosphate carboxylase large subunit-like protein